MNEKKLAERLARGDTNALCALIEAYSGYVRTVAYNFSRGALSGEDIDETTADVFYKLWNAREKINADTGLRSYLSVITKNAVKNRFRLNAKYPAQGDKDITELELPDGIPVEDIAELNEMTGILCEGLEQLSGDDREIFYRFYFNGEKSSQIAAAKGLNKSTVDMRLHRIRERLKSYLSERGYDHV